MSTLNNSATDELYCISPSTGKIYAQRSISTSLQINDALTKAKAAQNNWRKLSLSQRKAFCTKAVSHLVSQSQELANEISAMMGRPISQCKGEIAGLEERASYMIDICEQALCPLTVEEKPGFKRYITREALGCVFVIAPWNYPYLTAINSIVPALLAGNTVLLKHAQQTLVCAERFQAAFDAIGLPEGVFQHLHLSHQQAADIIGSGQINYVAFTGSVAGGKAIEQAAVGQFIGVGLELGGKDPAYIRQDAQLDDAVATVVDGGMFNSGQSCCGIERVYVHHSIYQAFIDKAVALIQQYQLGPSEAASTNLGPMVSDKAAAFLRKQIQQAISQGAVAHINSNDFPYAKENTPFVAPQLLSNVDHSMRVMTEESFGPLIAVQSVASDSEAIELMNDSEFGLSAAIFSEDLVAAETIGAQLETGTVYVNRCDYLDPALAWTGVKNSGRGCSLSKLGFEQLTRPKSFHIKSNTP
ncbi:aldehyde dehydrogenase family protein [Alginatibacterium sediminis]|uniref:Aldehyde dehydrogenase family protein n=1 Tax=Alginatibacterium sediminis TaxID=2164068 RepID=A0A420EHB4_9ALTE|nr:aldehyde dehydrogenase family protein [Alginatibacterium sediminis]RKF19946.1 aldehyde dehydrogenase family protein [Alginatibacterium sediminis]